MSLEKGERKKAFDWLGGSNWGDLVRLEREFGETFGGIVDTMVKDEEEWKKVGGWVDGLGNG